MKVESKANFDGLKELKKALNSNLETKVGILQGSKKRRKEGDEKEPLDNATIGMIHEVGSFDQNIPARSWLRMPIEFKSKEIQESILAQKNDIEKALAEGKEDRLYELLGLFSEAQIQNAFETHGFGQWAVNSASTIKQKGSASPLIDTGQLREAVLSQVVKKNG